jgi:hypothetical protein
MTGVKFVLVIRVTRVERDVLHAYGHILVEGMLFCQRVLEFLRAVAICLDECARAICLDVLVLFQAVQKGTILDVVGVNLKNEMLITNSVFIILIIIVTQT